MSRYLLDTGIAQDFINDKNGVRERVDVSRKKGIRIGICTPVLGELWSGRRYDSTLLVLFWVISQQVPLADQKRHVGRDVIDPGGVTLLQPAEHIA
jgi:hypothetical protein